MSNPDKERGILVPEEYSTNDIGLMLEAQMAISRPFTKVGIKARKISSNLRSKVGIQLSAVTCLWLGRKIKN